MLKRLQSHAQRWLSVQSAADDEDVRRAELLLRVAVVVLAMLLVGTLTTPMKRAFAYVWVAGFGVGISIYVAVFVWARTGRTHLAAFLMACHASAIVGVIAWWEGAASPRMPVACMAMVVMGCVLDAGAALFFAAALSAALFAVGIFEAMGLHQPWAPLTLAPWVPLARQLGALTMLMLILRSNYARLQKRVDARKQDLKAAVAAAEQLNRSLASAVIERTESSAQVCLQLNDLARSVSLDLRAPLEGIRKRLQNYVAAQPSRTGPIYGDVHKAIAAADRLMQMTERIREYAALGSGRFDRASVPLTDLARDIAAEYQRLDAVNVHWQIDPVPDATGDSVLLRTVLQNLLSNALKFSRGGAAPRIWFGFDAKSRTYFVTDNGVGFDTRLAARLFSPFARLHRAVDFEGDGVGLANVRRIIQRHNGRVCIEGKPGEGCTVSFSLSASAGL